MSNPRTPEFITLQIQNKAGVATIVTIRTEFIVAVMREAVVYPDAPLDSAFVEMQSGQTYHVTGDSRENIIHYLGWTNDRAD